MKEKFLEMLTKSLEENFTSEDMKILIYMLPQVEKEVSYILKHKKHDDYI